MDSIRNFKAKLDQLDHLLGKLKSSHYRVRQLKRNVFILRSLLRDESNVKSPYGPDTPFIRFSLQ
ncbi:MAG: hypothetical protein LHV69_05900 [Elusimicrobia bacterium]|nr:hypothetical protein [Candidatus Obscuribacterium magneticum]